MNVVTLDSVIKIISKSKSCDKEFNEFMMCNLYLYLLIGMGASSIEGAEMGSCSGNAVYNFKPVVNPPIVATSNKRHSIEENSKYS